MKKLAVVAVAVLVLITMSGCFGPMKLTRQFDDWTNQAYVDSAWLGQVLLYTGIIPAVSVITNVIDYLILNPLNFWGQDAFRGQGRPFRHLRAEEPNPR